MLKNKKLKKGMVITEEEHKKWHKENSGCGDAKEHDLCMKECGIKIGKEKRSGYNIMPPVVFPVFEEHNTESIAYRPAESNQIIESDSDESHDKKFFSFYTLFYINNLVDCK